MDRFQKITAADKEKTKTTCRTLHKAPGLVEITPEIPKRTMKNRTDQVVKYDKKKKRLKY